MDSKISGEMEQRVEDLEKTVHEMTYAMEGINTELMMQNIQTDAIANVVDSILLKTKSLSMQSKSNISTERLVFKHPLIQSDKIWKGNVEECHREISKFVEKEMNKNELRTAYFGATYDPERRMREHLRSVSMLQLKDSKLEPPFYMNILYRTCKMESAADLENRMIKNFPMGRNRHVYSAGLLWGKPTYFVYMLGKRLLH